MLEKEFITIGKRKVGVNQPTFIIAEVSCNHQLQYEKAEAIVRAAADAGADAVKLQTYTADTMTIDCDNEHFRVGGENNPGSWQGMTLHKLYREAYTPWEWQPKLKKLANDLGLELFSTPFDTTAVDFLENEVDPPCYKIASYEVTDIPLLEKVAQTGKPVIISNGYASYDELAYAIEVLRSCGVKDLIVLYCVTGYAETPDSAHINLSTVEDIRKKFDVVVGFSDNNAGIDVPVMSVLAGARVIEKHLILDRGEESHDARFSVEPAELALMVQKVREAEQWLGIPTYGPISDTEKYNTRWRRSLFVTSDIKKGERFTPENVRSIRPEGGLESKHYRTVIGRTASVDIKFGTPLQEHMIEGGIS